MLIKRSHIIPNFMYKGLRDELNRLSFVSLKSEQPGQYLQSGIYEPGILCSHCENSFSRMEDYACRVLYGGRSITIKPLDKEEVPGVSVSNIDYTTFKLFILSVLWRSHISKHAFFKHIDIREDEKRIRHLLLTGDLLQAEDYKICILAIKSFENELVRVVSEPTIYELNSGRIASFFIDGFIYFISLDKDADFKLMSKYSLSASGEIKIPILSGEYGRKSLFALGLPNSFVDYFIPKR